MRPSIDEQLRETQRILGGLAPQLDGYSAQILRMALANLETLETGWSKVLPFLHWDNDATLAMLTALQSDLDAQTVAVIGDVARKPACDPYDAGALQQYNEELQAVVVLALAGCGPAGRRRVHSHLLERTARYPMRPGAARPATQATTGG